MDEFSFVLFVCFFRLYTQKWNCCVMCSVAKSCLTLHLSPGVSQNSCPLSPWCYLTISSSATPFSFCLQSFPASGSFPMSWLFTPGNQCIEASTSANSPSNEYSGLIWFRIDWFELIAVQGTLKSLLLHHDLKVSVLQHSDFFVVQLSHPYMNTGKKNIALTTRMFVGKVMSLLFNILSKFVIAFLPKSKCLLIARLESPSTVILEPKKIKSVPAYTFSSSVCHEVMGPDAITLIFIVEFQVNFFSLHFHPHQEAL